MFAKKQDPQIISFLLVSIKINIDTCLYYFINEAYFPLIVFLTMLCLYTNIVIHE